MKYKFLHPSVYGGVRHEKDEVAELDAKTADALGEDTVVEVKEAKKVADKQVKGDATK